MLKERGLYRKLPELIQSENVPEIRYLAVATVSAASRGLWRRDPVTDDLSLGIAIEGEAGRRGTEPRKKSVGR